MASTPASILNDMRLSKISLLSLMAFALSNICDYMDLMSLNDIMPMFDLISNAFAAAADSWALGRATLVFEGEMRHLVGPSFGLRANAAHLVADQILTFSIPLLCKKMSTGIPRLWDLMISLLGAPTAANDDIPDEPSGAQQSRLTSVVCREVCRIQHWLISVVSLESRPDPIDDCSAQQHAL